MCLNTKAGPRPPQTRSEQQVYVKSRGLWWTGRQMPTPSDGGVVTVSSFVLTLTLCSCIVNN